MICHTNIVFDDDAVVFEDLKGVPGGNEFNINIIV